MKLTKLLPIVALSGIATMAAPLVTSCGGNGGYTPQPGEVIELKTQGTVTGTPLRYIRSNKINVVAGQKYDIKITMSDWTQMSSSLPYSQWSFGLGNVNSLESIAGNDIDTTSDENKLFVTNSEVTEGVSFSDDGLGFYIMASTSTDIATTDVVTLSLVFTKSSSDYYFFMLESL